MARQARFIYRRDDGASFGYFDEVIPLDNPLVSSDEAQAAIAHLTAYGWSRRKIAREAELGVDAITRVLGGRARIRQATEAAIVDVANDVN